MIGKFHGHPFYVIHKLIISILSIGGKISDPGSPLPPSPSGPTTRTPLYRSGPAGALDVGAKPVPAFRTSGFAIFEPNYCLSGFCEVLQIAPYAHAGQSGTVGALRSRNFLPSLQGLNHQTGSFGAQSLRQVGCRPGGSLTGIAEDLVDVRLLRFLVLAQALMALLKTSELRHQIAVFERFDEVMGGAAFHGGSDAVGLAGGGDDDNAYRDALGPKLVKQIQTVGVRKVDVKQDEIGSVLPHRQPGFGAGLGMGDDVEAGGLVDELPVDPGNHEIVFDDQDADHGTATVYGRVA